MGSLPPTIINLELKVNMVPLNVNNFSLKTEELSSHNFPFNIEAKATGRNGKEIPVIMQVNKEIIEEKTFSKPSEIKASITNDISKNENNANKNFSLFNSQNIKEISKENYDMKNNIEVNENNNMKNNKEINQNNNMNEQNDKIDNQKEKTHILKEGVYTQTIFGNDNDKEEINNNNQTPVGQNISLNYPKNPYEEELNKKTEEGININNNMGYGLKNEKKKDKYLGNNYSKDDLEMSQSIQLKDVLGESWEMIQKGYAIILMKLDDLKILPFFIKEENTLKSLVKTYYQYCPETEKGFEDDIKLYNGNRLLDINIPIKELNLEYPSIVSNQIVENYNPGD